MDETKRRRRLWSLALLYSSPWLAATAFLTRSFLCLRFGFDPTDSTGFATFLATVTAAGVGSVVGSGINPEPGRRYVRDFIAAAAFALFAYFVLIVLGVAAIKKVIA